MGVPCLDPMRPGRVALTHAVRAHFVKDLSGKVAVVTGAASGIGRATAEALAARGASVVIADVDDAGARATADAIGADDRVALVHADVRDEASIGNMVATAVDRFGRLDCACNVAGISTPPQAFIDVDATEWQRVLAVDLTGVFLCMQAELRQLLRQGDGGAIVNVSSGAGLVPAPGQPHYTAAKHAVLGLTKQAAQEYARNGIRVNAVLPGQTETEPMRAYLDAQPDGGERLLRRIPMGRMARPAEIAEAIAWLCSDASSYVSGDSLVVDGAQIAR
jgi:NAD(P)-dependent dehydrogenase (short-subunit alcohol dehydrogenase family)